MYGWMDGYMDGWIDGLIDGYIFTSECFHSFTAVNNITHKIQS